jgi:hypothetical protein
MKDFENVFKTRPANAKSRTKQMEVIHTLSSALRSLDSQVSDKPKSTIEGPSSPQKELFRVVDAAGNQFKIVKGKETPPEQWKPFVPPPPPSPVSAEQLKSLDRRQAAGEDDGEESLHSQLEAQILSQDVEAATSRGRRDRKKLDALLTTQGNPQATQIVLNTRELREKFSFFTPSEPVAIQDPAPHVHVGRKRRGVAMVNPRKTSRIVYRLISVKRQRKLKMKKHKVLQSPSCVAMSNTLLTTLNSIRS